MAESAINQPHPDSSEEDVPFDPNGAGAELDAEFDTAMGEAEYHDPAGLEDESVPEYDLDSNVPVPADDPEPEPSTAGEPEPEQKKEDLDRTYVVFQQVALTREILQRMLKHVEDGGSVVTVLAPLGTYENRNKAGAMRDAYMDNREALPKTAYLTAVTERSVKVHKIAPKKPVEPSLEITDEF